MTEIETINLINKVLGSNNTLNLPRHTHTGGDSNQIMGVSILGFPIFLATYAVLTTNTLVGGATYTTSVNVATTGGTGSGLTVNTTVAAGVVTAVAINNPGTNYTVGDVITITGGNGAATFHVATIATAAVAPTDIPLTGDGTHRYVYDSSPSYYLWAYINSGWRSVALT